MKTQTERIMQVFSRKTRNTLTARQAEQLGIRNLRARIYDLRSQGIPVETEFRSRPDGLVEAVYSISSRRSQITVLGAKAPNFYMNIFTKLLKLLEDAIQRFLSVQYKYFKNEKNQSSRVGQSNKRKENVCYYIRRFLFHIDQNTIQYATRYQHRSFCS